MESCLKPVLLHLWEWWSNNKVLRMDGELLSCENLWHAMMCYCGSDDIWKKLQIFRKQAYYGSLSNKKKSFLLASFFNQDLHFQSFECLKMFFLLVLSLKMHTSTSDIHQDIRVMLPFGLHSSALHIFMWFQSFLSVVKGVLLRFIRNLY